MVSPDRIEAAFQMALAMLLKERTPDGHWLGELSTSALSTATAVMALHLFQHHSPLTTHHSPLTTLVDRGLSWLAAHQNADGGWGDTTASFSNISTTMLCRSAIYLTQSQTRLAPAVSRAEAWLTSKYGDAKAWPEAIRQRYGVDRTFATPILTTCALAGLVSWDEVPPLPFELAVLPQSWLRFVRLQVVSYALPALIAIGQCIYHHKKPWNPFTRLARRFALAKSLRVLQSIQPSSGGFLEAIPLTSFVTLSLASCGLAQHPVTQSGVRFLVNAVRPDGSWAIDSNLATWVTTLSVNALEAAGELENLDRKKELRDWLLNQQYKERHPYTGTDPGGWAWTDLPGGVPDADDTAGAILAISHLSEPERQRWSTTEAPRWRSGSESLISICNGLVWLCSLQNWDGGIPTFCRSWGLLPFDRSGVDLTAHMLRAVAFWYDNNGKPVPPDPIIAIEVRLEALFDAGPDYLTRNQRPDGSWLPLWFGNQYMPNDENPTYGTARVLAAYRDLGMMNTEPAQRGIAWLTQNQNLDGGWGGGRGTPSTIEETALALDVLVDVDPTKPRGEVIRTPGMTPHDPKGSEYLTLGLVVNKGIAWLVEQIETGGLAKSAPIGFYFAKLWYSEKLYPIIFSVSALGRARRHRPLMAD